MATPPLVRLPLVRYPLLRQNYHLIHALFDPGLQ